MILRLLLASGLMLLISGCGKEAPVAPVPAASAPPAEVAVRSSVAARPAAPPTVVAANDWAPILGQLTQALRKYSVEHRRVPKTFEEFTATGVVKVPTAPPGKQFQIEPKRLEVILVDR